MTRTASCRASTLAAVATLGALGACLPPLAPPATNTIDVRYRQRAKATDSTVRIYRWFGSRSSSVTSRCKMIPTDSEMFAVRGARCGGLRAWYWGVARVLLEEAGSSRFAVPLRMEGRLRWVDLPASRCD